MLSFAFTTTLLLGTLSFENAQIPRKIESALIIGDNKFALKLSRELMTLAPDQKASYSYLIRSLGALGEEREMLRVFADYKTRFPEEKDEPESILEAMAFCILKKGFRSSHLAVKEISLLALAMTEDMEGVTAIKTAMSDGNKALRGLAVSLSGYFGDGSLREELGNLLEKERVPEIREALYDSIKKLKGASFLPALIARADRENIPLKEKRKIFSAIAAITEKLERNELEMMSKSSSSILRALAAHAIVELALKENQDLLAALLEDYHPDVKKAALEAMALLQIGSIERLQVYALDYRPEIAALACRALLLVDEKQGKAAFNHLLLSDRLEVRQMAAAALACSGARALPILEELIQKEKDPYIQCYIAVAFLQQRYHVQQAGELLYNFLQVKDEFLMEGETSFFSLAKSTLTAHPLIENYRNSKDQAIRFKLLNLLAIVDHPKAKEALRAFLKERRWEVVGLAAQILLSEGDESIISFLEEFLIDSDQKLRQEAALLLASLEVDNVIEPLKELYRDASLKDKLALIQALGGLGKRELIPFFVEELKNNSQTIRVASAAMLVRTLRS